MGLREEMSYRGGWRWMMCEGYIPEMLRAQWDLCLVVKPTASVHPSTDTIVGKSDSTARRSRAHILTQPPQSRKSRSASDTGPCSALRHRVKSSICSNRGGHSRLAAFQSHTHRAPFTPFASLPFRPHTMPSAVRPPRTLYDKVFEDHIVDEKDDGTVLLYIGTAVSHDTQATRLTLL